ncbi:NAD(P)-dependent oxidoreductase [Ahrensia marina]|uniref:NAD(P)-dependent oxidoreductase n=1 Tax=Ahrensia marina TaxID=1514904 RepID=UPI0035CEA9E0
MKIAFLGTGLMGMPMAKRLIVAGHTLTVWNRSLERAAPLGNIANVCATPKEAVEEAELVIMMLVDGPATRSVLVDHGTLDAMPSGGLVVDMGSVDPATDRTLGDAAKARGIEYLDAPVSGGVVGAEAGTLSIFVGGSEAAARRASPILEVLGRPKHLGPLGSGQIAKLANQVIVATTIGAVAEGFRLAEAGGCDLAALREALMGGFADSRILDLHGARMVASNFEPGGRSATQLKDLDNAAAQAEVTQLDLPLTQTVRDAFRDLVDQHGGADMDHAAYFHWLAARQT